MNLIYNKKVHININGFGQYRPILVIRVKIEICALTREKKE